VFVEGLQRQIYIASLVRHGTWFFLNVEHVTPSVDAAKNEVNNLSGQIFETKYSFTKERDR